MIFLPILISLVLSQILIDRFILGRTGKQRIATAFGTALWTLVIANFSVIPFALGAFLLSSAAAHLILANNVRWMQIKSPVKEQRGILSKFYSISFWVQIVIALLIALLVSFWYFLLDPNMLYMLILFAATFLVLQIFIRMLLHRREKASR